MTEFRKIIQFGKSSYVISLPKDWLKLNNLTKGDSILLEESPFSIKLFPKGSEEEKKSKTIEITVDDKDCYEIKRRILSATIDNYNIIKLKGKETKNRLVKIREVLNEIAAVEIVEQTQDSLVIEDLLDIKSLNLDSLIRRIDVITRTMSLELFEDTDEDCSQKMQDFDKDVNRLTFLCLRIIKYYIDNPLDNKTNLNNSELLGRWLIVTNLENLADHLKRLARLKYEIRKMRHNKEELYKMMYKIQSMYEETMTSFYKSDIEKAYKIADKKKKLSDELDKSISKNINAESDLVGAFTEKLKFILENIYNIIRAIYILK